MKDKCLSGSVSSNFLWKFLLPRKMLFHVAQFTPLLSESNGKKSPPIPPEHQPPRKNTWAILVGMLYEKIGFWKADRTFLPVKTLPVKDASMKTPHFKSLSSTRGGDGRCRQEASWISPHSPESRYQLEMSKRSFLLSAKCSTEMPAFHDQGRVDSGLRMSQCRKIAQSNRKVCP